MLKAIHAQENKGAARKKAEAVAEELRNMKLKEASKKICDSIEETLTYMDFPPEHWVPSSIMRKFIYKSGRTPSAQGRETCP